MALDILILLVLRQHTLDQLYTLLEPMIIVLGVDSIHHNSAARLHTITRPLVLTTRSCLGRFQIRKIGGSHQGKRSRLLETLIGPLLPSPRSILHKKMVSYHPLVDRLIHSVLLQDAGWLDFLSNNPSSQSPMSGQLTMLPPPTARPREVLSWQRERSDTQPYSLERENHTHSSAVPAPSEGRRRPTTDHKMKEGALDQDIGRGENEKRDEVDEKRGKDSN
jgi:hypothetical protein